MQGDQLKNLMTIAVTWTRDNGSCARVVQSRLREMGGFKSYSGHKTTSTS